MAQWCFTLIFFAEACTVLFVLLQKTNRIVEPSIKCDFTLGVLMSDNILMQHKIMQTT